MKTSLLTTSDPVVDINQIERLPLTSLHWLWLGLAALAWLMESYDIGLIGVTLAPLQYLWHLNGSEVGLLAASGTLGVALGVLPAGWLADKVGRKRVMVWALLEYSCATMLTAMAPNWHWFLVLRLVAGLGLGAMFPLPYTMITELSPLHSRGRMTGMLDAALSFGYFMAPLVALLATHLASGALTWRILFLLGGGGLVVAVLVSKYLPESPRWLVLKGRDGEAQSIIHRLVTAMPVKNPRTSWPETPSHRVFHKPSIVTGGIFGRPYRRRTAMLWVGFPAILLMFYAIMTFMPMILTREGLPVRTVDVLAAIIMGASIPGKWVESWLVETVGRKPVIVGFSLMAALAAILFPLMHGMVGWIAIGLALSFFGIAVDPAMKVYAAEQYPTEMRGTGVGFAEGWARLIGGALAPYILGVWLTRGGVSLSFEFIAGVTVLGALVVAVLGKETRGRPIEYRPYREFIALPAKN